MEIVKTNEVNATNNSSNVKKEVSGNIYWSYDKETKIGKLLLKKDSETYQVNNLNVKLNSMYLFVKEQNRISMSLLCTELTSNENYFITLPSYMFIDLYNNNPVKMLISNDSGKLKIKYLEIIEKKNKISDDDRKFFNILNFLANSDNSDLNFKIKIFIK